MLTRSGQEYECYLGSTSDIKIAALQGAFQRLGVEREVVKIKVPSNINEQPIGFQETFNGAVNRLTNLMQAVSRGRGYGICFAAENGIEFSDKGEAVDFAIVMSSCRNTPQGSIWVESKHVFLPAHLAIPARAHALSKDGGFTTHTIGQSLVDLGFTTSADNWHKELCGVSRVTLLEDAFVELWENL